jgi:mRNA-degrading endonuclease RelE of RelBE toxin-antitoxin system
VKYKVDLAPRARKQLVDLDTPIQTRIVRKLEELAENPRPSG